MNVRAALMPRLLACGHLREEVAASHDPKRCRIALDTWLDDAFRSGIIVTPPGGHGEGRGGQRKPGGRHGEAASTPRKTPGSDPRPVTAGRPDAPSVRTAPAGGVATLAASSSGDPKILTLGGPGAGASSIPAPHQDRSVALGDGRCREATRLWRCGHPKHPGSLRACACHLLGQRRERERQRRRQGKAAVPVRSWGAIEITEAQLAACRALARPARIIPPEADGRTCRKRNGAGRGRCGHPLLSKYSCACHLAFHRLRSRLWARRKAGTDPDRAPMWTSPRFEISPEALARCKRGTT